MANLPILSSQPFELQCCLEISRLVTLQLANCGQANTLYRQRENYDSSEAESLMSFQGSQHLLMKSLCVRVPRTRSPLRRHPRYNHGLAPAFDLASKVHQIKFTFLIRH